MTNQLVQHTLEQSASFPLGTGSVHICTKHGREVLIRHIQPTDDHYLIDLFEHLSEETRRFRFFVPLTRVPMSYVAREAHTLAAIDTMRQAALIALTADQDSEEAIGVTRLSIDQEQPGTAEFAIVLRDDYQRDGIGTVLLDLLVQVAMVRGLKRLRAVSLAENEGIHHLISHLGLPVKNDTRKGETTSIISLLD